ncbi:MAG: hypothetical protein SFX73_34580 [Kofleriaceae bacterium]|nr:hypothetical protein [Kofleriaceae bacterium]
MRRSLAFLLLAGCVASSPPPSPGLYYQPPGTPAPTTAGSPPQPNAPAPVPDAAPAPAVHGVVRHDSLGTLCDQIVAVHADGGIGQRCYYEREDACAIRQLGPDGEERGRSDLSPGSCGRWLPRSEGGGYLVSMHRDYKSFTITSLDSNGKRLATTQMTSKDSVFPDEMHLAADGGPIVAVTFREDLRFRDRKLGKTKFSTSGFVHFPPALDRLGWVKLYDTRKTWIAALLPSMGQGVDAIVNTRGPLVPGGPMNPEVNPADGSIYGGDTYGWKAERVSLDARGKQIAATELAKGATVNKATQLGDLFAMLTHKPNDYSRTILTTQRGDAERQQRELGNVSGFQASGGRTWLIECACKYVDKKYQGSWIAREIGGIGAQIVLGSYEGPRWTSVAVNDDYIAVVGTKPDPTLDMPVVVTAMAKLQGSSFDLSRLSFLDRVGGPAECQGKRTKLNQIVNAKLIAELEPQLAACGVPEKKYANISGYADGGLRTFTIDGATPEATTCARKLFEPLFTCAVGGHGLSFGLRFPPPAR